MHVHTFCTQPYFLKGATESSEHIKQKHLRSCNTGSFGSPAAWVLQHTHKHTCSSVPQLRALNNTFIITFNNKKVNDLEITVN